MRSLDSTFAPPPGMRGSFGWLCGFSASAQGLDTLAERFTGWSTAQRAQEGRGWLAAILDPGQARISPVDAPGVLHLPVRDPGVYRLLHAKVALLGFEADGRSLERLVVSTGNWTRQTLEDSLDLGWVLDVPLDGAERSDCADVSAATQLFSWLRARCDQRLLEAPGRVAALARAARARLDEARALLLRSLVVEEA